MRQRLSGLIFLASLLALIVPQRGLIVVAGTMLRPETVAALAALASILRVFDLVGEPAGRVFSTEMARHPHAISQGLLFAPWLAAGAISAGLFLFLPPVAHHFYGGRYDAAIPLLGWLIVAGAFRFVEIVPRGFLAYRAPPQLLNRFTAAQCACALLGLIVMVNWTAAYGARGLVCAGALIAAVRVGVSYFFFARLRRTRFVRFNGNAPGSHRRSARDRQRGIANLILIRPGRARVRPFPAPVSGSSKSCRTASANDSVVSSAARPTRSCSTSRPKSPVRLVTMGRPAQR